MLPRRKRVGKERFAAVWKGGSSFSSPHLLLKTLRTGGKGCFSVVAQKSAGALATERNLLRRRGYAIIARHSKNKTPTADSVVFIRKRAPSPVLEAELSKLLVKAGLI